MPLLDDLEGLSFRLFGQYAPKFLKSVFNFKEHLEKAGITIYPETYVSLMFLLALLTLPVSIIAIVLTYFFQFYPLLLLVPMPAYIMIGFIVVPMSMASERASSVEREMPFAATYVTVMASGGIPPFLSFKRLSEAELMPAVQKEAKDLIKDVEVFGADPLSALEKSARTNPSDVFREFVSGYASTVIIGGDVLHFLETKAGDIFKERSSRVKAAAERLGTLLESFIIIMVLMSLCFYILFSVESIYSTGMASYSTMLMYTYVLTPMLSFVFIYLAHNMQPKTPITEMRPYKVYAVSCAAAALLVLLLTNFFGLVQTPLSSLQNVIDMPTAVAIALVISAAPAAIIHRKIYSKKSSLEKGVAIFLRDLTEVRKSGLAPEKCIENLSDRDYGQFSKELKKITDELSWGIPLRKVFMDFVGRTKSWLTQIVMFLLVEAVDVGGGTIAMIESLTRFNTMTQEVEKEKKMAVRPYIMVPYFAAVLLVATTLMTLIFTSQTLGVADTGSATMDIEFMTTIFSVSVIIHCYLIGLVAGKISEEAISAGFKHSAMLVIIAIVASKMVPMFFGVQGAPS
jgi:flagellar protein FlaJ